MNFIFYAANALVLPPAMHFAWNFYRYKGRKIKFSRLWLSMVLLSMTVVLTSLQFIFPEIITMLNRDPEAVASGEWWRLITSIFIQPSGIWQCVFNGLFFISFVPIAEYLYGRSVLLIFFGASLFGQILILYWETTPGGLGSVGGGSSTALFGVVGALLTYVAANRTSFPKLYALIPLAGFTGALILVFFEDGHAPSVLMGGLIGLMLRGWSRKISPYENLREKP